MPLLLPVLPVESTSKIMIILVCHRWLLPTNRRRCLNRWWLICDRSMTGKWFQDSHSVHVACFEELSLSLSPWQFICSRLITNIPVGIQFCCIKFLQYMQDLNNMVNSTCFEFWNRSDLEILLRCYESALIKTFTNFITLALDELYNFEIHGSYQVHDEETRIANYMQKLITK